jgi:hypothetical protein
MAKRWKRNYYEGFPAERAQARRDAGEFHNDVLPSKGFWLRRWLKTKKGAGVVEFVFANSGIEPKGADVLCTGEGNMEE